MGWIGDNRGRLQTLEGPMKKLVLTLVLVFGAALLSQSWAQTPVPAPQVSPGEPETVYSGAQKLEDQSLSRRTIERVLAPVETVEDQYSRWKQPVCFNVYGLSTTAKYVVEKRMKEVAQLVGAPVDRRDPCPPSVTIIFTTDPQATLQSIAQVRPWLVPGLGLSRSRVREEQPIQAWYTTLIRGSGGWIPQYSGYDEEPNTVSIDRMSHLHSGIETQIGAVTVVVRTDAVMGLDLGALADHFALISLAEARYTSACKEIETIANLLHKNCDQALIPKTITPGDIALLTGLYKTPDDSMQRVQKARIIGNMRKTLEAESRAGQR
jgi:hypothetical protein